MYYTVVDFISHSIIRRFFQGDWGDLNSSHFNTVTYIVPTSVKEEEGERDK